MLQLATNFIFEEKAWYVSVAKAGIHTPVVLKLRETKVSSSLFFQAGKLFCKYLLSTVFGTSALRHVHH